MDDKQFDELMEKYVSSTKLGKDTAFEKLNGREDIAPARSKPKKRKARLFAAISSLCVAILALCIALPVALVPRSGQADGEDDIKYLDAGDFGVALLDASEVRDIFGENVLLPASLGTDMIAAALTSKADGSVAAIQVLGYAQQCGEIEAMIMPKGTAFSSFSIYHLFKNTFVWRGSTVKYAKSEVYNEPPGGFKMFFNAGDHDYYISVGVCETDDPLQALNLIFGAE